MKQWSASGMQLQEQEIEMNQCGAYGKQPHEQEMEMKQCHAYGKQLPELPTMLENMDSSLANDLDCENDSIYEKIPGES